MQKSFKRKVRYDGLTFDSAPERDRYIALRCRQIRGEISQLHMQCSFTIIPRMLGIRHKALKTKTKAVTYVREKEARYTCDFIYREGPCIIIEELKSPFTARLPDYILRRKLMVRLIDTHNARASLRPGRARFLFREVLSTRKQFTQRDI